MKNCKHFCTRLEDKSLSTCAPFIVCQKTLALSLHSLHPLQHIVTAAVIREVIKKKWSGRGVGITQCHVESTLRISGAENLLHLHSCIAWRENLFIDLLTYLRII